MSTIVTFVVGFALAGAFFFWLRRLGERMKASATPAASRDDGDDGEAIAENLGFAGEIAEKLARRRTDRRADDADNDSGGGDGGGDGG